MLGQFLAIFTNPGSLIFVLLLLALPLSWWRATRRTGIGLGSAMLLAVGMICALPLNDWVTRPLENYFPVPELPLRVDGIIVLGGAEEPSVMATRGWPELNASADRLIAFVALARQYPDAKLIFTGGAAVPYGDGTVSEADVAAAVLAKLGFDPTRVLFEPVSRNTAENARFASAMVRPQPGEVWIMVTSARHLPRAVATFNAVGWPVLPYPVDYTSRYSGLSPLRRLSDFNSAGREWLGLLVYRLLGRTDEWLPSRRTGETKP